MLSQAAITAFGTSLRGISLGPGDAGYDAARIVDLSAMKGIRVDPAARTVRAEPGLTIGEW